MRVIFSLLCLLSQAHAGVCVATCACYYEHASGGVFVQAGEKVRFSNGLNKNDCNQMRIYLPNLVRACTRAFPEKDPNLLATTLSAKNCTLEKTLF